MTRLAALGFLVVILGLAPPVYGQVALAPGSSVRLLLERETSPLRGVVSSVTSTDLTVALPDGQVRGIALADVIFAQVRFTRRNTLRGTLIGGAAGLLGSLLVVATRDDNCAQDATGICDALFGIAGNAALIWAPVAGAAIGALVGTFVTSERWVPGYIPGGPGGGVAFGWTLPL